MFKFIEYSSVSAFSVKKNAYEQILVGNFMPMNKFL